MGKKEKPNKIDEDLNKNLEDLLKDLSSQFNAQTIYIRKNRRYECQILNG